MAILTTRNLSKRFGGLQAVNNVDLDINEGGILGLIGPNGSGKTTFLNLLSGIFKPTSGKVMFLGRDVTGLPSHTLTNKGIGRTFQQNVLFKKATVWENVLIAHEIGYQGSLLGAFFDLSGNRIEEEEAQQSTFRILDETNLSVWKDKLCNDLPHGIQRVVEMAVAIAVKPKLMLLDEPFTGMNLSEITSMLGVIKGLTDKGITILLVEHQMKIVMNLCDRIVVLNFGEKIAEGSPEEIRSNKEVIKAYLGEEQYAS